MSLSWNEGTRTQMYEDGYSIQVSRSAHNFIPTSSGLEKRLLSADSFFTFFNINERVAFADINLYKLRMYIACIYDEDWFVGNIVECSIEHNVLVKFMKRSGKNFFMGPF